ncbi:MAG: DUF3800 domain-containing protein [Allopontixanthobacter sediminis]
MIDVNEIRAPILAAYHLPNVDEAYTFYYDETNNVRKLHLTPAGMNIRRPDCFVLGGILHRGRPRPIALTELRAALRLQSSVKEIKLKHLGTGGFLDLLASPKVESFLEWLTAQEFLVHYQVTDLLYWSIVDIVDSIVAEVGERALIAAHLLLKDSLYTVLRDDVDGTAELLGRYSYPNVGHERRPAFLAELGDLVEHREPMLDHFQFYMLKGLLQEAKKLKSLPYLEDETPNVLIDGFGSFFLNRLCLFAKAQHILDDEKQIEAYLESIPLRDNGAPLRHFRFADSQSEAGVQLSDPVAGLLGKLFSHLNRTPLDELEQEMGNLTGQQRRSLSLLARLLDASTDECPAFAQYVISAEDRRRASFMIEGEALERAQ